MLQAIARDARDAHAPHAPRGPHGPHAPRARDAYAHAPLLAPLLARLAEGHGPGGEPRAALALTWALAQLIVLTGTTNLLAPLVTGLYLFTFCLINLLAFLGALRRGAAADARAAPPLPAAWRPRWLALLGFLLSALVMAAALAASPVLAVALCGLLFGLLLWRRHALLALVAGSDAPLAPPRLAAAGGGGGGGLGAPPLEEAGGATLDERIERAAAYVHDALAGRFRGVHWAVGAPSRIRAQRLLRGLRSLRSLNIALYLALPFFEQPSWCYGRHHCGNATEVMLGGLPHVPTGATQGVEAVCVAFFACEMALKAYCMSPRAFFASPWHVIQLLLLVFNGALVLLQVAAGGASGKHDDDELLDRPQARATSCELLL